LFERALAQAQSLGLVGIILDMRNNGGGSGYLAKELAAYFFDEELIVGQRARYDETLGEFYIDPEQEDRFILAPIEQRYYEPVAVLVGPNCLSACEFFSYYMTLQDRATVVGYYPSGGLGGSVEIFFMPDGLSMQMTTGRALDADGNIHLEGIGVVPDIKVPVDAETVLGTADYVLEAAIEYLNGQ
jgi:C-terminal processing protease CtpA/Prc